MVKKLWSPSPPPEFQVRAVTTHSQKQYKIGNMIGRLSGLRLLQPHKTEWGGAIIVRDKSPFEYTEIALSLTNFQECILDY